MIEIRALKSASQKNMSPAALAALLAESDMALGLPCIVDSVGEAVRLLDLTDRQCAALQDTLSRGGVWKGQDRSGTVAAKGNRVAVRLATEAC